MIIFALSMFFWCVAVCLSASRHRWTYLAVFAASVVSVGGVSTIAETDPAPAIAASIGICLVSWSLLQEDIH